MDKLAEISVKNNLTEGSVAKQLIKYAIPFVLTSMLQSLYSMVDMFIAGQYIGSTGISAISNASQLMDVMTKIAIGLSLGGNIIISQYFGNKDDENYKQATGTLFTLFALLGIITAVIFYTFGYHMLISLKAPALEDAWAYLKISSIGLFFIMCYNALSAVLRALGNSKSPFHFILISTVINIILDILFVGQFKLGTAGAALATVISQGISFVLALIYIFKRKDIFEFSIESLSLKISKLKLILKLGVPCAVQMTVAGISWLTITFLINKYGVDVSAGAGISAKIRDFCTLFIHAMSSAASTMIAQNLGAKKYDRAKEVMYIAMKISLVASVIIIILVEVFAPSMVALFTDNPLAIEAGINNLRVEIIGQIFYAIFLIYHSLMTGAGHTWIVFASSFTNCILARVILALALNHFFGLWGIYIACAIATSSSVPIGYFYTKSNVWRRSLADEK